MRDNTFKLWLLAVSLALLMPSVHAAGLGRLTVHSTLGQPLNAEVELLSVQKNETITGRLATPDVYQQANVPYNNSLVGTRVTVEKRPNGQIYLKVTTPRPVSEPFLEVLVEINSENGRTVRQYTALLDPPGYGRGASEIPPPRVEAAPETRPPVASAPAKTAADPPSTPLPPDASATPPPRSKPAPSAAAGGAKQYGPIKPGETLGRIARSVKPDGVTLEQALVGLYRENPDAFIRKNMNLVKSGKILRVPEANQMTSLPQREARQEVRLQVADFNTFRNRLADRAGAAPESGSVTTGRIGTRVAEPGEGPKDTVRLSRGETSGKGKGKGADRVRALEEEAIAREKALTEANARISQLEQIIQDTKRAAELKTGAAPKGTDKAGAPAAVAVTPPGAAPTKAAEAPRPAAPPTKAAETPPADKGPVVAEAPKPPEAAPAPKPEPAPVAKAKPAPPPAPAPEPGILDMLTEEPLYLAALGGVVLLGGVGFMMARRRRGDGTKADGGIVKIAPSLGGGGGGSGGGRAAALATPPAAPAAPAAAAEARSAPQPAAAPAARPGATAADDNDLDFGAAPGGGAARAAPAAQPTARPAPEPKPAQQARPEPQPRTPEPPPRPAAAPPRAAEPAPRAPEPPRAAPQPPKAPVPPPRAPEPQPAARAVVPPPVPEPRPVEPLMPDFALDQGGLTPKPKAPADDPHVIDFNLEPLPPLDAPMNLDKVSSEPPVPMDFKLDLADLDINAPAKSAGGPAKDDHWYDVQQKFDLAKAYEEMGDKDGARDILQEVMKEGDVEQKAQAQKLLGLLN